MYADIYVNNKEDIPTVPHWTIIQFSTIIIPGDERSKQCPGHGYSEHDQTLIKYEVYNTEHKWKQAITERENSISSYNKNYVALKVEPVKIEKKIIIEVNYK